MSASYSNIDGRIHDGVAKFSYNFTIDNKTENRMKCLREIKQEVTFIKTDFCNRTDPWFKLNMPI